MANKIGIMQPYLFPYIGYFQTIHAVDKYVFYDDVQYIKRGWINRNNFLIGGNKFLVTIKLSDASSNKMINEIEIADDFVKFLKTIQMAYSKAPQFTSVFALIEDICSYPDKNLARFTANSLVKLSEYMGIETEFVFSSDLHKNREVDAQERIIQMCEELDGKEYYNAIGGMELYDRSVFEERGLDLFFVKANLREYKQKSKEFVPGLSIIDVLMYNDKQTVKEMLDDYELK